MQPAVRMLRSPGVLQKMQAQLCAHELGLIGARSSQDASHPLVATQPLPHSVCAVCVCAVCASLRYTHTAAVHAQLMWAAVSIIGMLMMQPAGPDASQPRVFMHLQVRRGDAGAAQCSCSSCACTHMRVLCVCVCVCVCVRCCVRPHAPWCVATPVPAHANNRISAGLRLPSLTPSRCVFSRVWLPPMRKACTCHAHAWLPPSATHTRAHHAPHNDRHRHATPL
jgi:hypothetical protein